MNDMSDHIFGVMKKVDMDNNDRLVEKARDILHRFPIPNDMRIALARHFAEAFKEIEEQTFKAGFEAAKKEAAEITGGFAHDPYTSDTGTECENVRNLILEIRGKHEQIP